MSLHFCVVILLNAGLAYGASMGPEMSGGSFSDKKTGTVIGLKLTQNGNF